jgi:hypothetical protein
MEIFDKKKSLKMSLVLLTALGHSKITFSLIFVLMMKNSMMMVVMYMSLSTIRQMINKITTSYYKFMLFWLLFHHYYFTFSDARLCPIVTIFKCMEFILRLLSYAQNVIKISYYKTLPILHTQNYKDSKLSIYKAFLQVYRLD